MKQLYNEEAEYLILGTIIIKNVYYSRVSDILESKHFGIIDNVKIYQKIVDLINSDQVANLITLRNFFESEIKDGRNYLTFLAENASVAIDIRQYAYQIIELAKKRQLETLLVNLTRNIESVSLIDIMNELDTGITQIDTTAENIQLFGANDLVQDWKSNIHKENNLKPIPTNLASLDRMLNGGLQKGGLYVLAASSGCGKTFFSQNIILNALKCDLGAYFVSMEMQKRKIFTRFISIIAKINSYRILKNNIYQHEEPILQNAITQWESYKKTFLITDLVKLSASKIESALRRALRKNPVDLMVIDYAQIMELREAKNMNEASLIKENVVKLAQIAKKYDIAVLLLSQLTKDKINGRVGLGSLKGSGGLYEDADCVFAMWADEEQPKDAIKKLRIEVLKNRDGLSGGLDVEFDGEFGRFTEINNGGL